MVGHEGPKKKGHAGKAGGVGRALLNAKKKREGRNRLELVREEAAERPEAIAAATDSVTAVSSLQDFLAKAEMADADFTAERNNFRLVSSGAKDLPRMVSRGVGSEAKRLEVMASHAESLRIPRRPAWDEGTTAEELSVLENASFLDWRRRLAEVEEQAPLCLTPFERNLELWRQLWRVLERSQVLLQLVDARNPLLFRSLDLETYASEMEPPRPTLLLLNKADLLTEEQRKDWAAYFRTQHIAAVFWSALAEDDDDEDEEEGEEDKEKEDMAKEDGQEPTEKLCTEWRGFQTNSRLYNVKALLALLRSVGSSMIHGHSALTVGCVGYPNVGKSSTLNRILGVKKVSVSATPGKTRHFQTLQVEADLWLCDCPGLVMPSFSFSRDEMLLNGILPAAQMRGFAEPMELLCQRFPAHHLQAVYGLALPPPPKDEAHAPSPAGTEPTVHMTTPSHLLTSLAFLRGYMSSKGVPDSSRAARILVSDVVSGKLCWVAPPPGHKEDGAPFNDYPLVKASDKAAAGAEVILDQLDRRHLLQKGSKAELVDRDFFRAPPASAHTLNPRNRTTGDGKKHGNGKRREKLRRVFGKNDA